MGHKNPFHLTSDQTLEAPRQHLVELPCQAALTKEEPLRAWVSHILAYHEAPANAVTTVFLPLPVSGHATVSVPVTVTVLIPVTAIRTIPVNASVPVLVLVPAQVTASFLILATVSFLILILIPICVPGLVLVLVTVQFVTVFGLVLLTVSAPLTASVWSQYVSCVSCPQSCPLPVHCPDSRTLSFFWFLTLSLWLLSLSWSLSPSWPKSLSKS
ncbi:hypothetical protein AOLI_G00263740 [Acnodon oligacanthus]